MCKHITNMYIVDDIASRNDARGTRSKHLNQHVVSFFSSTFHIKVSAVWSLPDAQNGPLQPGVWWGFPCFLPYFHPEDAVAATAARTIASCHVGWKWRPFRMTSGRLAMALPRPVHHRYGSRSHRQLFCYSQLYFCGDGKRRGDSLLSPPFQLLGWDITIIIIILRKI